MSGCSLCASTGQCDAAFHNGPGKFCDMYYDRSVPCCCPLNAQCKVSRFQCMCTLPTTSGNNYYNPSSYTHRNYSPNYGYHHTSSVFPLIIFIILCICCCSAICSRRDENHHGHHHHTSGHIPVATAVPAATCPPPPAENPAYYGATNYGSTGSGGGGGSGAAIASGLGGLAVGTILGDLIGRNNAQVNNNNIQRGFGFGSGGGYDIVGDSGDTGGYDIQGDTGGYGIAGDS